MTNSVLKMVAETHLTDCGICNFLQAMYRRIVETRTGRGEMDPEITLQLLKSAIYYILTDKENLKGHLNAIESILGYNENERLTIEKVYRSHTKK
jgi:hypothetical protein